MAYKIAHNKLKNGDVTYFIKSINRIPGSKNKFNEMTILKFSEKEIIALGFDVKEFLYSKINELKNQPSKESKYVDFKVNLNQSLCTSDRGDLKVSDDSKNLGYVPYSRMYHRLELDELINNKRRYTDCEFNINVIFQHLIYSRCLWPASKKNAWEHKDRFFGDTSYEIQHVYRCMDYLLKWRDDILIHLDKKIKEKFGRKDTVVFYDVTNYYFELDTSDDENGLRAKGVSKEHRPEPIIQMGLFMDELSLPITYELFRGNTNDCSTLEEAMDKSIIDFSSSRKIIVADKGMMSFYNILKIRNARNGYVISQSIRKSDENTKAFALSSDGWEITTDENGEIISKIKERTIPRKASTYGDVDKKKHSGTYNERQVFIWSKKYADRAKFDRQEAIEKAKEFLGSKPKNYKDSSYGKNKYLIKSPVKGGEKISPDCCIYEFDESKLSEDELYDGYYVICTNVIGVDNEKGINKDKTPGYAYYRDKDGFLVLNHVVTASEIVNIYGGLWKIEETFKVTKTGMLNLRPVFHSNQDRIRAHFLICFMSLVLERLLEMQLGWKYSARTIQESLSSFNAVQIAETNIYQLPYYDIAIHDIMNVLDIPFDKKFMTQEKIRKLIGNTKKKDYEN